MAIDATKTPSRTSCIFLNMFSDQVEDVNWINFQQSLAFYRPENDGLSKDPFLNMGFPRIYIDSIPLTTNQQYLYSRLCNCTDKYLTLPGRIINWQKIVADVVFMLKI